MKKQRLLDTEVLPTMDWVMIKLQHLLDKKMIVKSWFPVWGHESER